MAVPLPLRAILAVAVAGVALAGLPGLADRAEAATPTPIPRDSPWLTVVNYYRSMAGLNPVVENPTWAAGTTAHSCYMLQHGPSHDEVPGLAGYTAEGRAAGMASNVTTSSGTNVPPRVHIELWMTGPFHAIGLLRHNWKQTSYGQCERSDTPLWRSGATLDVLRGVDWAMPRPSTPTLFPGHGTTTHLSRFVTESPNPLDFCGWPSGGGLPLVALMPESFSSAVSSITGPDGPLQTCTLHAGNTTGTARSILSGDNGVIAMPRHPLTRGTYWVTVTTTARTVSWSFTVDPDVADVPLTPAANTYVTGPRSGFTPSTPTRLVDSRVGLGVTRLAAGIPTPITAAGRMGVPGNATAISANFTALRATEAGYVSLFPCGADVPVVSTVNFNAGQIVPNAAIVSLAGNGTFCAYASTPVDLVVDVNGAFAPEATGGAVFVTPQRVFDTRTGHRAHERLGDQSVLTVRLSGAGTGVPADATAVVLNVTAYRPTAATYVTAWPTGQPRPIASNLNMSAGEHRANLVIVPLGTDGRVSFYTEASTDLFGDLVAYISDAPGAQRFTPLSPTRMADTREARQTLLNAGTHGAPLAGGTALQVAMRATRGIPDDATAVALNITTVGATAEGFVTVYPCTAQVPFASTVNPLPGQVVPNAAVAQLSPGGSVCVYASHTTHVVIDVVGYWS